MGGVYLLLRCDGFWSVSALSGVGLILLWHVGCFDRETVHGVDPVALSPMRGAYGRCTITIVRGRLREEPTVYLEFIRKSAATFRVLAWKVHPRVGVVPSRGISLVGLD